MSVSVRVGFPLEIITGMTPEVLGQLPLGGHIGDFDAAKTVEAAIRRWYDDPEVEGELLPGLYQTDDQLIGSGLPGMLVLLEKVHPALAQVFRQSTDILFVDGALTEHWGFFALCERRDAAEALDALSFHEGPTGSDAEAVAYNVQVLRHALSSMTPGMWVYVVA